MDKFTPDFWLSLASDSSSCKSKSGCSDSAFLKKRSSFHVAKFNTEITLLPKVLNVGGGAEKAISQLP
jgi:hypothetical protein